VKLLTANEDWGQFPPSYYAASAPEAPDQPVLQGEIRADVCVIGGGFTGLSAALRLAELGYDVVLLEAHRIGWGASGRNGGQLGSGQRKEQPDLEKRYGLAFAKDLWRIAEGAKTAVKRLIDVHEIDCDPPEELRSIVNSPRYSAGELDMDAAHLHPLKFARGLGAAARKAGVRIFEMSEVQSVGQGAPVVVKARSGSVVADAVVLGCNGYLDGLVESVARKVMPINNFIIATEPLSDAQAASILSHDYAVADSKFVVNYFRLSADRRLLFGGRESYGYRFPRDIKAFVRKAMVDIFPQTSKFSL